MNTTKFWGGGEKWHYETAVQFAQNGYNTHFILEQGSVLHKKIIQSEVPIKTHCLKTTSSSFLNIFKLKSLANYLKKEEIQTVIFNGPKDLKLGGLSCLLAKVKQVVYRRGIAVKIKSSWLNQFLFKKVVTHFVFNSKATKSLVEENYSTILKEKKTTVIYNALPIPPSLPMVKKDKLTIGNAGRLVEQKGQIDLISLAEELRSRGIPCLIKIAGDGPLKSVLEEEIKSKKLSEYFNLMGFTEDMDAFMQSIDVLVSTAYWEGFGFVLAEAMLHSKPVIAYDTSSNPELIQEGENGYLVPVGEIKSLADKISILANDDQKRLSLGDNGRLFAMENFEKTKQFNKLLSFLQ